MTTRATKTAVKREAQRVFADANGFRPKVRVSSFRDFAGACWLCVVNVSNLDMTWDALTKQGALQDAYDCLAKLERKTGT